MSDVVLDAEVGTMPDEVLANVSYGLLVVVLVAVPDVVGELVKIGLEDVLEPILGGVILDEAAFEETTINEAVLNVAEFDEAELDEATLDEARLVVLSDVVDDIAEALEVDEVAGTVACPVLGDPVVVPGADGFDARGDVELD